MRTLTTISIAAIGTLSFVGMAVTNPALAANPFTVQAIAKFDQPWAMTFLPDGRMLVTEKPGQLWIVTTNGQVSPPITGVPQVAYGGQGGLGDVVLHPNFASNNWVYLSFAEADNSGLKGAAVARAKLNLNNDDAPTLENLSVIWRQYPKVSGSGHYGHRIAFSPDGYLFISSGERQKFTPAQDMAQNLGKMIRLNDDGTVPASNPFFSQGGVAAQVWSLGHRNPLGLAFDVKGELWSHEMGPRGGDELNLIKRGGNYGYPIVSDGDHYSGKDIPDHSTRPEFNAPLIAWTPVISPGGLVFYTGDKFKAWRGNALIAGLSSRALIRVSFDGNNAREVERFPMGQRIREVEQGPNGNLWLLENGPGGRLLKLTEKN
ncbi:MAG: PQQ-dependent sugar dehydrogenase [Burkholderiaceae bacterium]